MRYKVRNKVTGYEKEFDTRVAINFDAEYLRFVGTYQGKDFWEGDTVQTSDKKLTKVLEWIEKDYGFGAMWYLTRYAEKSKCKLRVLKTKRRKRNGNSRS